MDIAVGYPPGSVEGSGAWQWVSDQVVAGICHDLSDRLSSLLGLLQLAELESTIDPAVSAPLRAELGRVEELVHLLRLLPAGRAEVAEPIRVVEAVPVVSALLRRHRGLEDLRLRTETSADPLIHVRWSMLVRLLLLVAVSAGRAARAAGGSEVVVRIGSGEGMARIEVLPAKLDGVAEGGIAGVLEAHHSEVEATTVPEAIRAEPDAAGVLEALSAEVEAVGGSVRASAGDSMSVAESGAASGTGLLVTLPLFGV